MTWYPRIQTAIKTTLAFLAPTQATNLALLVSALLTRRTFCLSDLARAYPLPPQRRSPVPKHDLLHRLKRLWRFLNNPRVDPMAVQLALIPSTIAHLGLPRSLGLAIDWTMFDTKLPTGQRRRYQVLRIAVPRRGRALPLLQLAYDRDALPAGQSQNQLEETALLAVVQALPSGVRPVILADRGFARAPFLEWLQSQHLDYVVRVNRGTCLTDGSGRHWKLGEEGLERGERRWLPLVHFGLYHDRPRSLTLNIALSWRLPRHLARSPRRQDPEEPWYLATSLQTAQQAVAWYQQRWWIEASFKDSKSRFRLKDVQVSRPDRLSRLLMALTIAWCWLAFLVFAQPGTFSPQRQAAITQWGRVSFVFLALAYLDTLQDWPLSCLPGCP